MKTKIILCLTATAIVIFSVKTFVPLSFYAYLQGDTEQYFALKAAPLAVTECLSAPANEPLSRCLDREVPRIAGILRGN